jgi:non-heme chloroperoxidase
MFEYQFTELLKHGYRCVGIDLRGFGDSDKPWDGYNYDTMADDLRAVLDTVNLQNVTLVGFSMGGAISIHYMARHQGSGIAKLALLGAAAPCFTKREDFPYGIDRTAVDDLISQTYSDRPAMLKNFSELFFANPQKHVPTLILHGVDDHICLFDLAKAMHDSIKDSELVSVEKAGHGFYYEEKEKVNSELIRFIG